MSSRRTKALRVAAATTVAGVVVVAPSDPAEAAQVSGTGQFPGVHTGCGAWCDAPQPGGWFGPGNTGNAVGMMQNMLRNSGIAPNLAVDGVYGPATTNAVRLAQGLARLRQDGLAGNATWDHFGNPLVIYTMCADAEGWLCVPHPGIPNMTFAWRHSYAWKWKGNCSSWQYYAASWSTINFTRVC